MKHSLTPLFLMCCVGSAAGIVACGAGDDDSSSSFGAESNGTGPSTGIGSTTVVGSVGASMTGGGPCNSGPNEDRDMDGITAAEGDCNDCDPNTNPSAVEVVTDPNDPNAVAADENCNGETDEVVTCDDGLAINDSDAMNAARAIELCTVSQNGSYGVVSAAYVRANGTPNNPGLGAGLVPTFGVSSPRAGARMLALSSGHARQGGDPDECPGTSCDTTGSSNAPPGFPQNVPGCDGATDINDDAALEVSIIAPSNANGYSFDFAFYSHEYSTFVCSDFNDQFIARVTPAPAGSIDGNISFDSNTNPVSVNIALFDHCAASTLGEFASFCQNFGGGSCPAPPNPYCPQGAGFLSGTGYEAAGSTGFLQTTAPIAPGEQFTITFTIWDTGDTALDSVVIVDKFQWLADPGTKVGTTPGPN